MVGINRLFRCLCAVMLVGSTGSVGANEVADTIFLDAKIYTANANSPDAEAMAVSQGRILAVGKSEQILHYQGPSTRMLSLEGRRVMPGLIDAHSHAIFAGLAALAPNLEDQELSPLELAQQLQTWLAEKESGPDVPMVVFGVNPAVWSAPESLSALLDAGPWQHQAVLLMGADYHTAWANHAMREKAGIDAAYVQSLPAKFQHTVGVASNGQPDGVLVDAGLDKVTVILPKPAEKQLLAAAKIAVETNNRYGITAWMDPAANAGPGEALFSRPLGSVGEGILPAYRVLSEAGLLTAHVAALLVASPESDAADLERLDGVRKRFAHIPNLSLPGIKVFADGVLEYPAQSAALLGRYENSGKQGELLLEQRKMTQLVDAIDQRGWLVHIHALGDRAVRVSLDAIESARKKRSSGVPHSITHLQLVSPADYPRFKQLDVMAVMQLHWAELDNYLLDLVKPYIPDSEFQGQYPARSLQQHGAVIVGASDWPISTANPWEAMHHAMTRSGPDGGLNAGERMDKDSMFRAYTINAARAIRMEREIGSLEVGKQADFIVLDRDVLEVDVEALKDTQVLATYFAGRQVYSAAP